MSESVDCLGPINIAPERYLGVSVFRTSATGKYVAYARYICHVCQLTIELKLDNHKTLIRNFGFAQGIHLLVWSDDETMLAGVTTRGFLFVFVIQGFDITYKRMEVTANSDMQVAFLNDTTLVIGTSGLQLHDMVTGVTINCPTDEMPICHKVLHQGKFRPALREEVRLAEVNQDIEDITDILVSRTKPSVQLTFRKSTVLMSVEGRAAQCWSVHQMHGATFSPTGKYLALESGGYLMILDVRDMVSPIKWTAKVYDLLDSNNSSPVWNIQFVRGGTRVVFVSSNTVRCLDLMSKTMLYNISVVRMSILNMRMELQGILPSEKFLCRSFMGVDRFIMDPARIKGLVNYTLAEIITLALEGYLSCPFSNFVCRGLYDPRLFLHIHAFAFSPLLLDLDVSDSTFSVCSKSYVIDTAPATLCAYKGADAKRKLES